MTRPQHLKISRPDDLGRFLRDLKSRKNPLYFPLALTQFGLGLRIGEACGLSWGAIEFRNKIVKIEQTVIWDMDTWRPSLKPRPKNGHVRYLVAPDILLEELQKLYEKRDSSCDLVFHKRGEA